MRKDIPDINRVLLYLEFGDVYVCTLDNHFKFWTAVALDANTIKTTFGAIGKTHQEHTKTVPDAEEAIKSLIKEKLRKGYEKLQE